MSYKESLLDWCKRCTKNYSNVEISNLTTSWNDGIAFNALLHSHRPELFDFNEILSKSPIDRLENAFKIITSNYYIEPNTTPMEILVKPDRNKITNLLNMLYDKLTEVNSSDEYENNNSNLESGLIIKRYQEDVEDVLTWILGAEDKLNIEQENNSKSEESLDTVQHIFQSLDDFTTESSDKQKKIEDILREGQLLMKSILSNADDIKEIQIQRDLLNDKWEELKNMIMDKQERLHNTLMSLQKKQLNDFSEWLKTAEHKISTFSEMETDLDKVKEQFKEHMQFQNEVREHEPMVKTLSSMLIIIDECENPNFSSENLTDDLVDQLEALAEKWKNVCTIVEERETTLNIWIMLLEQEIKFNNWAEKISKRLQDIKIAASEASASRTSFLSDLINRLDKMKKDVNVQLVYYFELFDEAKVQLKKINKDSQAAIKIKSKIETLSKQWHSIIDQANMLSDSIRKICDVQNEQIKLERKGSIRAKNEELQRTASKRYKLDKWKLEEWKKSTGAFLKSLRKYQEMLGVQINKSSDEEKTEQTENNLLLDDLDLKEQEILIDETQNEFEEKECEYQNLVQQGNFLIEELKKFTNSTKDDTIELEELIETMKQNWNDLKSALNDKQLKVNAYFNLVKLHGECDVMNRVLKLNNNRLDNEKIMIKKLNTKQNFNEINKIYEQCKLRNKSMLGQKKRVQTIEDEFNAILEQYPKLSQEGIVNDLKSFLSQTTSKESSFFSWQETNQKMNDFQLEIENILKLGKLVKKKEAKLSETYPKLVDAIDLLDKWLIKTYEIVFFGQLNLFWTSEQYDEQLKLFKALEKDINNEKENLDYINETGEKVIQLHLDAAWTTTFKNKVRDLNLIWNETIEILTSKIQHLESLQDLIPKLDNQIKEFWVWLDSAQDFLKDSIEYGDFEMMEEQIKQYDALIADIDGEVLKSIGIINEYFKTIKEIIKSSDTLQGSNSSINELSKANEDNNRLFKDELSKKVKDVVENWNLFRDEAVSKRDLLIESLRECRKINEKIDNLDKEIEKIKCDKLMINDIDFLKNHCAALETTKERLIKNLNNCTKMKSNLENINESSKFKTKVCLEKMINKVKATENKCSNLIDDMTTICSNGKTIRIKYDELCKMYNSRANWLDKLEQIISRSTQELVDSEEISDYIDNLENHLKNKPEDVCLDKVEQLINDLNELFFDAYSYVDKQEDRWSTTTAEAGNRNKQLHQILSETQELEQQLLILQEKLKFIESNLDNSVVVSQDKQLNVEHIENKFKDANQMINFLNEQIYKLLAEQRNVASNRFKEQLKFLQITYTELDKQFNELKNVPDVKLDKNTLIDDLKKVYDDLQNRELTTSETDLIQQKLFEVTQPLPELQNRIQELQKSTHSLSNYHFSNLSVNKNEKNTVQSTGNSKASIPKSHSDLNISNAVELTNGLVEQYNSDLMENQDLNAYEQNTHDQNNYDQNNYDQNNYERNNYERNNYDQNNYDQNNYEQDNYNQNNYDQNYDGQQQNIPQPIEINLNIDNSEYSNDQEELFEESVDFPWERCIASNFVPYYKNHELRETFWNHPNMMQLMDDISELNEIYYAAYRTSSKLRIIQQTLFLNCIHITNMCKIFDTFDFKNDNLVTVPEIVSIFKRIYEDISAKFTPITNFGLIIDLGLNWVLNLYDLDRTGYVDLLAFKTSLVCLSRASIEEKYKVLYQLIADSKGFADRQSVGNLLKYMLEIPKLLGDIAAFGGSNVEPSIRSCFEEAQNKKHLNVKNFLCWLKKEPQCLVWLPLLHRLIIAEGSRHPVKCSVCKAYPMVGFRFKCLKCFNTNICQQCFLLRCTLSGHKNTHPIKEYCYVTGSGSKEVSDFSKIVRNKFKSSRKSFRKHFADSYLPVNSVLDNIDSFEETNLGVDRNGISLLQYSPLSTNRDEVHNKMEFFANKLAEAELNETIASNSYSGNPNLSNQINQQDFKLSKSISDEHDLIMNYCNVLNGTGNSSVLSNKFASLNDSSSKVSQTSSLQTPNETNGCLNSRDYLNDELDEHQLVKSYCSILANSSRNRLNQIKNPNQVLNDLSENSKKELSILIKQLEKENLVLEHNYEELKKQKYGDYSELNNQSFKINGDLKPSSSNLSREEMLIQKCQLEKHTKNLESRMKVLEEQNLQLQHQLSRLKLFLDQD